MKIKTIVITFTALAAYGLASYGFMLFTLCGYESSDRNWDTYDAPFKGVGYVGTVRAFEAYKKEAHDPSITLFRTSKKNWANPLAWPDYFLNPRWDLPYIEPLPHELRQARNLERLDIK